MEKDSRLYKGLIWSAVDRFSIIGVQIIFEVLMARILSPKDYGLMGMLLVIMSFTQIFIDSGFGSALIFKKNRTETDFSTAFYTSGFLGVIVYIILLFVAPFLSDFYKQDITLYIRVISIAVIFNSLSIIYKTRLVIVIDFKSQAKFSFLAVLVSGISGLTIAYWGFGIWALIAQNVLLSFFNLFFLFINLKWIPKNGFSKKSFYELFNYGSKLLYAAIINSVYINFNPIILGRLYSPKILGLYTKSSQFTINPISTLTGVIQRVFFPYMTKYQGNNDKIFKYNNSFNKIIFVILLPVFTIVVLFSDSLIKLILSEKWVEMVEPFNILLTAALFYPLIVMNMNIFQVIGKTSRFLFIEILTKIVGIGILIICYRYGLTGICLGILIQFMIQYIITSFFVSKTLNKNFFSMLKIFLYFIYAGLIYFVSYLILKMQNPFIVDTLLAIVFVCGAYFLLYLILYKKQMFELYNKINLLKYK